QVLRIDGSLTDKINNVVTLFTTSQPTINAQPVAVKNRLNALKTIFQQLQEQLKKLKRKPTRKEMDILAAAAGAMGLSASIPARLQTAACLLQAMGGEAAGTGAAAVSSAFIDAVD